MKQPEHIRDVLRRLFPVAPPPVLPVADPATTADGLRSVREALGKGRTP